MTINKKIEQTTLFVAPIGRIDTTTAPELDSELVASLDGMKKLVLDFKDVPYISSAGLRVVLKAQKHVGGGNMKLIGVNATVMEVFEITGFTDILTIE